jgi:hypothetical protein
MIEELLSLFQAANQIELSPTMSNAWQAVIR